MRVQKKDTGEDLAVNFNLTNPAAYEGTPYTNVWFELSVLDNFLKYLTNGLLVTDADNDTLIALGVIEGTPTVPLPVEASFGVLKSRVQADLARITFTD